MADFYSMRNNSYDRDYVDPIKENYAISSVIGESTRIIRCGTNMKGCCPFHDDRNPSMTVNDEEGWYNCFVCGGGDVINFVMKLEGIGFKDALRRLADGYVAAPVDRAITKEGDAEKSRIARNIWNDALPIPGTPAEAYLESRQLPIEFVSQQENLRFARLSFDGSKSKHPALVAAARNCEGEIVAIQRIYLTEEGAKFGSDCKRSLGPTRGAAIRLSSMYGKVDASEHIHVCEGLEDGLSIARINEEATVWVTMGASNLAAVVLPASCTIVTVAGDNDDAGTRAAELATASAVKAGRQVLLHMPPPAFKDWNAYLKHWESTTEVFGNDLPWRYIDEEDLYDKQNNWIAPPDVLPVFHPCEMRVFWPFEACRRGNGPRTMSPRRASPNRAHVK